MFCNMNEISKYLFVYMFDKFKSFDPALMFRSEVSDNQRNSNLKKPDLLLLMSLFVPLTDIPTEESGSGSTRYRRDTFQ